MINYDAFTAGPLTTLNPAVMVMVVAVAVITMIIGFLGFGFSLKGILSACISSIIIGAIAVTLLGLSETAQNTDARNLKVWVETNSGIEITTEQAKALLKREVIFVDDKKIILVPVEETQGSYSIRVNENPPTESNTSTEEPALPQLSPVEEG